MSQTLVDINIYGTNLLLFRGHQIFLLALSSFLRKSFSELKYYRRKENQSTR